MEPLTLCLLIIAGVDEYYECNWEIYIIHDHTEYLKTVESRGFHNPAFNQIGVAFFDLREIYLSWDHSHRIDEFGMNNYMHEIAHAWIYEQWLIDPLEAIHLAHNLGVDINIEKPFRFH